MQSIVNQGMARTAQQQMLDRSAAADLWRHTLSQIPSVFGRLVYLSSLRNSNSDSYEHHGFAQMFGADVSDKTLRESHSHAFQEWIGFRLEEQKADLDLYLSALGQDKRTIVESWLRLTPYRHLVPGVTKKAERELYLSDFGILLTLLKNDYGAACPDSDA
jgi:hypothetical protein